MIMALNRTVCAGYTTPGSSTSNRELRDVRIRSGSNFPSASFVIDHAYCDGEMTPPDVVVPEACRTNGSLAFILSVLSDVEHGSSVPRLRQSHTCIDTVMGKLCRTTRSQKCSTGCAQNSTRALRKDDVYIPPNICDIKTVSQLLRNLIQIREKSALLLVQEIHTVLSV